MSWIFCFKGVSVFGLIVMMMVELTKQRRKKKEEETKMTQNEEKSQGLVWINEKYFKSMKHHK